MALTALIRSVPESINNAELTHLERCQINVVRAREEHKQYRDALVTLGCVIRELPSTPELPDSVFVEDTAVVFDEIAVIARPGAESRRPEIASVAQALRPLRPLSFIESPGLMDGGDVLRLGKKVVVGKTDRTNTEGIEQLQRIVAPYDYEVQSVPVTHCLHLKSAVTRLDNKTVLLNSAWIDRFVFVNYRCIEVHPDEPSAANVLSIGEQVLLSATAPQTARRVERAGYPVTLVEAGELAKAEGGLTCCSLLVSS